MEGKGGPGTPRAHILSEQPQQHPRELQEKGEDKPPAACPASTLPGSLPPSLHSLLPSQRKVSCRVFSCEGLGSQVPDKGASKLRVSTCFLTRSLVRR